MVPNRKISLLPYDIVKFLFVSEEGVRDMDEEIIIPDEPPVYEPPPEYNAILKSKLTEAGKTKLNSRRWVKAVVCKLDIDAELGNFFNKYPFHVLANKYI